MFDVCIFLENKCYLHTFYSSECIHLEKPHINKMNDSIKMFLFFESNSFHRYIFHQIFLNRTSHFIDPNNFPMNLTYFVSALPPAVTLNSAITPSIQTFPISEFSFFIKIMQMLAECRRYTLTKSIENVCSVSWSINSLKSQFKNNLSLLAAVECSQLFRLQVNHLLALLAKVNSILHEIPEYH